MTTGFEWRGHRRPLFDHPYNATITNERAVEVPIALDFLARGHGHVLEVGNVLGHYFTEAELPPRVVVDAYEIERGVTNIDVFMIDKAGLGPFDLIVSVSTLEHVRWDPQEHGTDNPYGGVAALWYLKGLLKPNGRMLVTALQGHNWALDAVFEEDQELGEGGIGADVHTLGRRPNGEWQEGIEVQAPAHERVTWIAEVER